MDSIFKYIAIFMVIMILGSLLPYILPILLIIWFFSLFRTRKTTHTEYYEEQPQDTYTPPKHDAIDVEFTEREDDSQ